MLSSVEENEDKSKVNTDIKKLDLDFEFESADDSLARDIRADESNKSNKKYKFNVWDGSSLDKPLRHKETPKIQPNLTVNIDSGEELYLDENIEMDSQASEKLVESIDSEIKNFPNYVPKDNPITFIKNQTPTNKSRGYKPQLGMIEKIVEKSSYYESSVASLSLMKKPFGLTKAKVIAANERLKFTSSSNLEK